MIDVNVSLDLWPFRRLPHDRPESLVGLLRDGGVTRAWACSFDAMLHRDVAAVNARIAETCRRHGEGLLVPFGTVNPALPDWQEDLRRCHEVHKMPGIRLFPSYHGYTLADPRLATLLGLASECGLLVQVAWKMEDERTQHPLVTVPTPDPSPLLDLVPRLPKLRLILLNALRDLRDARLERLTATGRVWVEIAMLEGVGGLESLIPMIGARPILFGSFAPLFIFQSAALKLRESVLTPEHSARIREGNAQALLDSG